MHEVSSGKSHYAKKHDAPSQHIPSSPPSPELTLTHALHPHLATKLNHELNPERVHVSSQLVVLNSHSMIVTLETRILEHNMQQKAGIPAGNLVMATKTSSIKSHQTIIQQNEKQCHEEIT